MELLYLAAAAVVVFLCVWCYRQGVKDGIGIKRGKEPAPVFNPPEKLSADEQRAIDEFNKKLEAIAGYDMNDTYLKRARDE